MPTFSRLFVGPCADRPEVINKGPDYAVDLLSMFYAGARCPLYAGVLWRCSGQGVRLREGEPSSKASLESLQAKRLWRTFKQSVSGEPSSKAPQTLLFLRIFPLPFLLPFTSSFVFWQLA